MASSLTFDVCFAAVGGERGKGFFIQDARVLRKLGFHIAQVRPLGDYCRVVANRVFRLPLENERIDTPTRAGSAPLAKTPPEHFSHTSMALEPHSCGTALSEVNAVVPGEAKVAAGNNANVPLAHKANKRAWSEVKAAVSLPAQKSGLSRSAPKPRRVTLLVTLLLMILAYLATLYLLAIGWPHL